MDVVLPAVQFNDVVNAVNQVVEKPESVLDFYTNFKWQAGVTPLASLQAVFFGIVIYLVTIYLVYKATSSMNWRIELKWLAALHNLNLFLLSATMLIGISVEWGRSIARLGIWEGYCDSKQEVFNGPFGFWSYIFFVSKYYELFDTVLIVLKGKKPIFLHVYHHCVVLPLFWSYNETGTTQQNAIIIANCLVHTVMYFYYFLSTLGISCWWKKYITQLQLLQFLVDMLWVVPLLFLQYFSSHNCYFAEWTFWFGEFIGVTFILLFGNFYIQSYRRKGKKRSKKLA